MDRIIAFTLAAILWIPLVAAGRTPAESKLDSARARIERSQSDAERAAALVALAAAHTARARETGDPAHYRRALEALARARALEAEPRDAGKIEAFVRLGRHEFQAAEALADAWTEAHPADAEAWGLLGDARMELGRTEAAAAAYQRMLELRPGPAAYVRAAYWRERTGDLEGALDLLERSLVATGHGAGDQRAWTLVQIAALQERAGRPERAEAALRDALSGFPGYHFALAALADHLVRRGRSGEALPWARRALAAAPHPERWLTLADALRGVGRSDEARAAEDTFEREALENLERADNENVYLVDFYLDRRPDPARALEIARLEAARRPDPPTLARLARALRATGGVVSR